MKQGKTFLPIDGNFFAHRTLHGIRSVNDKITLDSDEEMCNFNNSLINSFHAIFDNFVNENYRVIDQIVMVFDHVSWRKGVEQFRPFWMDQLEKDLNTKYAVGYKENRKELKEESNINFENFDYCVDIFRDYVISLNIIPVFHSKGAEGDDNLIMLKEKLLELNPNNKMIVFCTDGDLKQLLHFENDVVADSVILFRNIKSKLAPEGEFVLSKKFFLDISQEKDMMAAFLSGNNSYEKTCTETIFKINLKDKSNRANFERNYHADIVPGNPYLTLLTKIFVGDKKDNVFPILRWANSKKSGFTSITEKTLQKAFDDCFLTFNEETAISIFKDKKILSLLIFTLIRNSKKEYLLEPENRHLVNEIGKHFSHNRKILTIINTEFLPNDVVNKFNMSFEEQRHKFNITLTKEMLGEKMKQNFATTTGIIASSLPTINVNDLPDELKILNL